MSLIGSNGSYAVEGLHTFAPGQKLPYANFRLTSPGFFTTLGIPLVRGRDFTAQDRYDSPFVVIVSQALVRELFPNQDPDRPPRPVRTRLDELHVDRRRGR